MKPVNQHYRIPLVARPAGGNEIYTDETDNLPRHRVRSPDAGLAGWLPAGSHDPAGCWFRYNLGQDTAMQLLWPLSPHLLAYAHLELNGRTTAHALITPEGVYWRTNLLGQVPWPATYVGTLAEGDEIDQLTLVLDCIA